MKLSGFFCVLLQATHRLLFYLNSPINKDIASFFIKMNGAVYNKNKNKEK